MYKISLKDLTFEKREKPSMYKQNGVWIQHDIYRVADTGTPNLSKAIKNSPFSIVYRDDDEIIDEIIGEGFFVCHNNLIYMVTNRSSIEKIQYGDYYTKKAFEIYYVDIHEKVHKIQSNTTDWIFNTNSLDITVARFYGDGDISVIDTEMFATKDDLVSEEEVAMGDDAFLVCRTDDLLMGTYILGNISKTPSDILNKFLVDLEIDIANNVGCPVYMYRTPIGDSWETTFKLLGFNYDTSKDMKGLSEDNEFNDTSYLFDALGMTYVLPAWAIKDTIDQCDFLTS
jgi:hypothetical protein